MLVLTAEVDQEGAHLLETSEGEREAIGESPAAAAGADLPAQGQLALLEVDIQTREFVDYGSVGIGAELEESLDDAAIGAGAHAIGTGGSTQDGIEGA